MIPDILFIIIFYFGHRIFLTVQWSETSSISVDIKIYVSLKSFSMKVFGIHNVIIQLKKKEKQNRRERERSEQELKEANEE